MQVREATGHFGTIPLRETQIAGYSLFAFLHKGAHYARTAGSVTTNCLNLVVMFVFSTTEWGCHKMPVLHRIAIYPEAAFLTPNVHDPQKLYVHDSGRVQCCFMVALPDSC